MERETIVRTAKTVEEAIEIGLLELGVDRAEVEIDVVSKGRAGILGIGAEPARVRVTRIAHGEGNAGVGLTTVSRLLKAMSVTATPSIVSKGSGLEDPAVINVEGEDAGLLIGRRGETLQAFQFMVDLLVTRQEKQRAHIVVDVEQYRERRQRNLEALARRMAERVVATGRPIALEPMSSADRRIIHMALEGHGRVTTASDGEGRERKVTIQPASGDPQARGQTDR